jgi:hypothetical protein
VYDTGYTRDITGNKEKENTKMTRNDETTDAERNERFLNRRIGLVQAVAEAAGFAALLAGLVWLCAIA